MGLAISPPFDNINTPQPTIEQQQNTAAADLPKIALGIKTGDTQSLVEVDKQSTKVSTEPNRPTLKPLNSSLLERSEEESGDAWKSIAQGMLKSFSPEVQEKLIALKSLSRDDTASFANFGEWSALAAVLAVSAKSVAFTEAAVALMALDNKEDERRVNSESVSAISSSMADQAEQLALMVKESLREKLTHPELDECAYLCNQLQLISGELTKPEKRT